MLIHDGRAQMSFAPAARQARDLIQRTWFLLVEGSKRVIDRYSVDVIGNATTQGGVPSGTPSWSMRWACCQDGAQMPEKHNPAGQHSDGPRTYPGEKARQGEIILRKPWMRVVFVAGLVGCVLLALGIRIAAGP
jgi:hypothetical protein